MRNRRLRRPLSGSHDWYEFDATVTEKPLLGGMGNLVQYDALDTPNGSIHAVALRRYNVTLQTWSIYWATAGSGSIETPTIGAFADGVGTFIARKTYSDAHVLVRVTWTHSGADACRREQAFSNDDGLSWELNGSTDFTRRKTLGG